jgi:myosin heavy subunit
MKGSSLIISITLHVSLVVSLFIFNSDSENKLNKNALLSNAKKEVATISTESKVIESFSISEADIQGQIKKHKESTLSKRKESHANEEKMKSLEIANKKLQDDLNKKKKSISNMDKKYKKTQADLKKRNNELELNKSKQKKLKKDMKKALEKQRNELIKKKKIDEKKKKEKIRQEKLSEQMNRKKHLDKINKIKKRNNEILKNKENDRKLRTLETLKLKRELDELERKKAEYAFKIQEKIFLNWVQDFGEIGWECSIEVIQNKYGTVLDFSFSDHCHNDGNFRNSIKKAVYSSAPLPLPQDENVFESKLRFTFVVE